MSFSYVDHPCCITLFEVIQDRSFIEVGHHGHVLNLVILRGVHWEDLIVFDGSDLNGQKYGQVSVKP